MDLITILIVISLIEVQEVQCQVSVLVLEDLGRMMMLFLALVEKNHLQLKRQDSVSLMSIKSSLSSKFTMPRTRSMLKEDNAKDVVICSVPQQLPT